MLLLSSPLLAQNPNELQQATATLKRGEPRSVSDGGMVVDPPVAQWRSDLALARRVLRFLEPRKPPRRWHVSTKMAHSECSIFTSAYSRPHIVSK